MRTTDHANRDLKKLHEDVAFKRSGCQIIWQPRIGAYIRARDFTGEGLPTPYTGMTKPELYRSLHCSDRLYNDFNGCFGRVEDPRARLEETSLSETDTLYKTITPVGTLTRVTRSSRNNWHEQQVKWPVVTEEDFRVAVWLEDNVSWKWDQAYYDCALARLGDLKSLGAPTVFMPKVNIQNLYIGTTGVESSVYALADFPEVVEEYFRSLDDSHDRLIDVINASPIDIINFGDNLHCGTLSPDLFKRYVQPSYLRRCERLHRADKFVSSHWDGDVAAFLPFARSCGLDGIEAITPKPQGDVELEAVKDALGDMVLLDGIDAILFDSYFSEEQLLEQAQKVIDLFAPNLILGISDEISSTGEIERIRLVGRLVDDYNAAIAAKEG